RCPEGGTERLLLRGAMILFCPSGSLNLGWSGAQGKSPHIAPCAGYVGFLKSKAYLLDSPNRRMHRRSSGSCPYNKGNSYTCTARCVQLPCSRYYLAKRREVKLGRTATFSPHLQGISA